MDVSVRIEKIDGMWAVLHDHQYFAPGFDSIIDALACAQSVIEGFRDLPCQ